MPREIEKQLMKELERALKEQDKALEESSKAKAAYDVAAGKTTRANDAVKALSSAITALREHPIATAWLENVIKEARENIAKEKPAA
jgi:hypothetical protein